MLSFADRILETVSKKNINDSNSSNTSVEKLDSRFNDKNRI